MGYIKHNNDFFFNFHGSENLIYCASLVAYRMNHRQHDVSQNIL